MTVYLNNNKINVLFNGNSSKFILKDKHNYVPPEFPGGTYIIELDKFNISNKNNNALDTTTGINNAISYAKEQGYKKIKLPPGEYLLTVKQVQSTHPMAWEKDPSKYWVLNMNCIYMRSNMEFDIEGCIFRLEQTGKITHYGLIDFAGCNNSVLKGGTLIGDRYIHDYYHIINRNRDELEIGAIDDITGLPVEKEKKHVRTKNFITDFRGAGLLKTFKIIPLENTCMNTVDGGRCFVYCYDENNAFLGMVAADGWGGYLFNITLIENTVKIKISFWGEWILDAKWYIAESKDIYPTTEFGTGVRITDAQDCWIVGTEVRDFVGDCIATNCPPAIYNNDNFHVIGCKLENSRRQGISLTGSSNGFVVYNTDIGYINGVDPQSGIDIEVEGGAAYGTVIDKCRFYGNQKCDFIYYNSKDVEIKNCIFNGGISTNNGKGLILHDNIFKLKTYDYGLYKKGNTPYVSIRNKDNKIYNNIFDGETAVLQLEEAIECYGNTFKNGASFRVRNVNVNDNNIINSSVIYDGVENIKRNETIINSSITLQGCLSNSFLEDSQIIARDNSKIINSEIIQNTKPFQSTWTGFYNVENSNITTNYKEDIPFISANNKNNNFISCNFNMSASRFSIMNYGNISLENCSFRFRKYYDTENGINFIQNVSNGACDLYNNNFIKGFEAPSIKLPIQVRGIVNNDEVPDGTEVII